MLVGYCAGSVLFSFGCEHTGKVVSTKLQATVESLYNREMHLTLDALIYINL